MSASRWTSVRQPLIRKGRCGAFALLGVRARKLRGLYDFIFFTRKLSIGFHAVGPFWVKTCY